MAGTGASLRLTGHGFATLPAGVDLQPTPTGTWTNTGLQITLPQAGTYHLAASVRGVLTAVTPCNVFILARLLDVTTGAVVPDSEVLVQQIDHAASPAGTVVSSGANQSAPILIAYTVPASRLVRLQVARTNVTGTSGSARIESNASGRTTLLYERVA
ncbi:hypothetical protein AB0F88_16850 [Streptosporangium sp. NPDC023963]|uniref:hypothetical protein n=1 Tax=Streptosporangium sp. NPDC023963 TaxID=3155608 RepID=UPI00343A8ED9